LQRVSLHLELNQGPQQLPHPNVHERQEIALYQLSYEESEQNFRSAMPVKCEQFAK